MGRPGCSLRASLANDPIADGNDETGLLGQWNEIGWTYPPVTRLVPPQQGFETGDLVVLQIDERLVEELELPIDESGSQVPFQIATRLHALVHARLEES